MARRAPRPPRIHACNVLAEHGGASRLHPFVGGEARPGPVLRVSSADPLPPAAVGKGWAQLVRRRLDIAWLAGQPVFLQLVLLPTDDPTEVPAMLEHQIEKISPFPVAQIVWGHHVLPQRPKEGLPVIVVVAERTGLEATLGGLEKRGFFADCVESPVLQLIVGTSVETDGAYVFHWTDGEHTECLVGWAKEGCLRSLSLVNLAAGEAAVGQLAEELGRLSWAGELEGWLPEARTLHLVTDAATAAAWGPLLEARLGVPVESRERPSEEALALAAARDAVAGGKRANLLPPESGLRYQQQFTDRLWMGGLLTMLSVYLACVLVYLGAVEVQKVRRDRLANEFGEVNTGYTNALRMKAQTQVLQETMNLRYAALDCWLAAVEAMPEELVLENLSFSGGQQSLQLTGLAPADQEGRITEYWQALRRKVVGNTNLFSDVQLRPTQTRTIQGTPQIQWTFSCKLQRPEI
jgi:hypothetical protein